jgi:hypothetical protein
MADESAQTLLAAGDAAANAKTISGVDSDVATTSSSSNAAVEKMVKKGIPLLTDYWKKSTVTEADWSAYHNVDWLPHGVESFIPDLEFPTVYFESYLVVGFGLPPSKFLVSILNFLKCELVHLNPNAIDALSCFTMSCECWLGIALDTSLFCYFYYPARYDKTVDSGIGMSLRRHRQKEYLDATFKGCWKGASQKWFLVEMHVLLQWTNKHLLLPQIDDKQGELEITPRCHTPKFQILECD